MFGTFKILCAIREGPYGVLAINALAERILAEADLIRPDRPYYHGRPVMITVNDYGLRLFNGDVGIILRDPDDGRLYAWFEGAEERSRRIPVGRLPGHETVYAMTIHKSQGSEFEDVLMMLPNRDSRVLTRELVYTGITRARKHLDLWARDEVLQAAVSRRIERTSGLRDALWGASTIHPSPFHHS
jgi:exodeoxyribonuclease V alpha subunit